MTELMSAAEADRALKKKHRAMWASGDYPMVATELIPQLGPMLVQAAGITAGQRVLDVAAGSGNASIPAALTGAQVVASDLTPELLAAGRRLAARAGAELTWREADAEALPFTDGEFDAVISCVGVMFAPRHQAAADELVRVCRPGGRIALIAWTPAGFVGQMFATMKPYGPPPPPGAQPPPLWGVPEHVSALLADRVSGFVAQRRTLRIDRFAEPAALVDYYKTYYGPTIAVYRSLADHPERAAALDRDLIDLVRRFDRGGSGTVVDLEYLVITAGRRG